MAEDGVLRKLLKVSDGQKPDDWQRELVARTMEVLASEKADTEFGQMQAGLLRETAESMRESPSS